MDFEKKMKKMLMTWVVILAMVCFMAMAGGSFVKVKKNVTRAYTPASVEKPVKFKKMLTIKKVKAPLMLLSY
jgi:hypothetical protein